MLHLAPPARSLGTCTMLRALSRRGLASATRAAAPAASALEDEEVQRFSLQVPPLETVGGCGKPPRADAFLSAALPSGTSRARVSAAIKAGALSVNGRLVSKPSQAVHPGDKLLLVLSPPPPLEAAPEDLPLEVVYEDAHVLVVNKAAHMVVHPSAGHERGTLVNAVLHHCALPAMRVQAGAAPRAGLLPEEEEGEEALEEDDEEQAPAPLLALPHSGAQTVLRPGIVHRLDKGTSGLLVVAKNAAAHAHLCAQFSARQVHRRYEALHLGAPFPPKGRVEAPVGRDPTNRLRMAVVWAPGARGARAAASRYEQLEALGRGGCSRVAWRLETGRTHQVRVHAKHQGMPLLGDPLYGGSAGALTAALLRQGVPRALATALAEGTPQDRPCLHAAELGFTHPATGEAMSFRVQPPPDFLAVLEQLRALQ